MDNNLSTKLERIDSATDQIRTKVAMPNAAIEDVANAVDDLVEAPSGAINISANGNNIDVSTYATANVNVSGGSSDAAETLFNFNKNSFNLPASTVQPIGDITYTVSTTAMKPAGESNLRISINNNTDTYTVIEGSSVFYGWCRPSRVSGSYPSNHYYSLVTYIPSKNLYLLGEPKKFNTTGGTESQNATTAHLAYGDLPVTTQNTQLVVLKPNGSKHFFLQGEWGSGSIDYTEYIGQLANGHTIKVMKGGGSVWSPDDMGAQLYLLDNTNQRFEYIGKGLFEWEMGYTYRDWREMTSDLYIAVESDDAILFCIDWDDGYNIQNYTYAQAKDWFDSHVQS